MVNKELVAPKIIFEINERKKRERERDHENSTRNIKLNKDSLLTRLLKKRRLISLLNFYTTRVRVYVCNKFMRKDNKKIIKRSNNRGNFFFSLIFHTQQCYI